MMMWSLLGATFVLCAIAGFPTKWWVDMGRWSQTAWRRRTVRQLERALARQAGAQNFVAGTSFLPSGVGLALDPAAQKLFLAVRDGNGLTSAILPFSAVREVQSGEVNDSGFHDYYVDLTMREGARPVWRLLCGEDSALASTMAAEVEKALA